METTHIPVMLPEVLQFLSPPLIATPQGVVVDGTLGEGGHTEGFLKSYKEVHVIGIDADKVMIERARTRLTNFNDQVTYENRRFDEFLEKEDKLYDVILLDLGISTYHLKKANRGFSFNDDSDLDMRLDSEDTQSAHTIVNTMEEEALADIIFKWGEERYSRPIARRICARRKETPFTVASDLANEIYHAVPRSYRYGKLHPATRTFQAIRIAVNRELERLQVALEWGVTRLAIGGRMGIITFHSLEDRIVKQTFRTLSEREEFSLITKKPIAPSEIEIKENAPSRSAKLRVIERVEKN